MNDTPEYWTRGENQIIAAFNEVSNSLDFSGNNASVPKWILHFQSHIWSFYAAFGRDFTWRNQITPYRVLVSETMLQQTQTTRVKEKFPRFIKRFPSFKILSQAKRSQVLEEWSGLARIIHQISTASGDCLILLAPCTFFRPRCASAHCRPKKATKHK